MKSFKIREGKMLVDGVYYSDKPNENVIKGKMGRIHSINIGGRQFFPYGGEFNDGTTPIVTDDTTPTKSLGRTELVESSGKPLDENGKPLKVKRTKKG